jgi:hypothetical protein
MHQRPRWVETLTPDDITAAKLRRAIEDAARPLLAGRRDSWWEVASNWATLLTPVAAVLTLLFAGLAIQQGVPPDDAGSVRAASADVVEPLRSEVVPAGFTVEHTDDASVVFAALREADAPELQPMTPER